MSTKAKTKKLTKDLAAHDRRALRQNQGPRQIVVAPSGTKWKEVRKRRSQVIRAAIALRQAEKAHAEAVLSPRLFHRQPETTFRALDEAHQRLRDAVDGYLE